MIAIITAAAENLEMYGLDEHLPLALLPLVDRPIVHHVVDYLAAQGVRRFEFVLSHLPEKIEAYLGDGTRWGCSFQYHLLPPTMPPLQFAEALAATLLDEILLGRADRIPEFRIADTSPPTLFLTLSGAWTGWAMLPASSKLFRRLAAFAGDRIVPLDPAFREVIVARELSFENPTQLLRSQAELLAGHFPGLEIGGTPRTPGVWVSRNVSLHPTATLEGPLFVGANCKVEAGVRLGPFVVLSSGCIVDEQSSITNSLVAPNTYIGQALELDCAIVNHNRLVNARVGTGVLVSENFLISGLERQRRPVLLHELSFRVTAFALFLLALPAALLTLLALLLLGWTHFTVAEGICIPAADDPHSWSSFRYLRLRLRSKTPAGWWLHFATEVWPGLLSVIKGDLSLLGVQPRSGKEIDRLPYDWRSIYLGSTAGLITEALVMFGREPNQDELFTAEAYYSATQSFRHDLRLLRLYLQKVVWSNQREPVAEAEEPALMPSLEERS